MLWRWPNRPKCRQAIPGAGSDSACRSFVVIAIRIAAGGDGLFWSLAASESTFPSNLPVVRSFARSWLSEYPIGPLQITSRGGS